MEHEQASQEDREFVAPTTGHESEEEPKTLMHLMKEAKERWGERSGLLLSDMDANPREDLDREITRDAAEFSAEQIQEMIDVVREYKLGSELGLRRLEWARDMRASGELGAHMDVSKRFPG